MGFERVFKVFLRVFPGFSVLGFRCLPNQGYGVLGSRLVVQAQLQNPIGS